MYENIRTPIISKARFRRRVLLHVIAALGLLLVTLTIGVAGHVFYDAMPFSRAVVASTTLMSGLGLSIVPDSIEGQLFASAYGILCGYVYIATSSMVVAPLLHRMLHTFHMDHMEK